MSLAEPQVRCKELASAPRSVALGRPLQEGGHRRGGTPMTVPFTTDATFADDVLASPVPVLVDFTAPWCAPCKMMAPVIENLAVEQAARMKVIALDVDENPVITDRYHVMGMPTLGLFIGGELVTTVVGGRPGYAVMQALEPFLPSAVTG